MRLIKHKDGMTIIEILIASVVIGICIVAIMATFVSSMYYAARAREMSVASDDFKDVLEKIRCTPFPDIVAVFPDGAAVNPNDIGGFVLDGESIVVNYPNGTDANPLLIEVALTWNSMIGGMQTVTCRTQRTNML